ncbi:hypothetical protein ACQR50_07265 [Sphingomonas sp. Xoc002]|uniref:ATP-dependent DNA ligase n=1 Tax=Sphingomonas sp. Xoc002 TaxID=2837624 RepID=UPI003D185693
MVATDLSPMEAKLVSDLPDDEGRQFEPKWDGFRALIFRQSDTVEIMSKSGKPLSRYFPEVVQVIREVGCPAFVLDGELILPVGDVLSFDALQARLHPAVSRVERLSRETPAQVMLLDCLMVDDQDLLNRPLAERRARLDAFHRFHGGPSIAQGAALHGLRRRLR